MERTGRRARRGRRDERMSERDAEQPAAEDGGGGTSECDAEETAVGDGGGGTSGRDAEEMAAEGGEGGESGEAADPAGRHRLLTHLAVEAGLCAACVHLRLLASPRSVFVRCGLAASDPAFPRYPALPVVRCAGFRQAPGQGLAG